MSPATLPAEARVVRPDYMSGILLILLGTVAFSSAGLFVRLLGKDAASILFWRGLFTTLAVVGFVAWRERRRTWASFAAIGRPGLLIAALSAASMACFITSLQYTTVANNSIIFGTAPFLTAGMAWAMIGERPSAPTMLFSLLALAGALLVLGSSLSAGNALGDGLAVLMTLTFAWKTVLVRRHRDVPMVPAAAVGALMAAAGAVPFVQLWRPSLEELALFALFGLTQQGAGLILTTIGVARVPAAHSALLMSIDLPMSPLWVWLAFGERPAPAALAGGLVVLAAIIGHIVVEGRRRGMA